MNLVINNQNTRILNDFFNNAIPHYSKKKKKKKTRIIQL